MSVPPIPPDRYRAIKVALFVITGVLLGAWLMFTPAGLLGKADAIGYAVCHRIAVRSFLIGERTIPLCARCSGMYLGALAGMLYQLRFGKRGAIPEFKYLLVFGAFFVAFGVDGMNSYLHLFPSAPGIYEPANWLRLLTGTGMGLGIAVVLYPTVNQALWDGFINRPALTSWKHVAGLIGIGLLVVGLVLTQNPLIMVPLAILSAATVLGMLSLVYAVLWAFVLKTENNYLNFRQAAFLFTAGFATALAQIAVFDLARFLLTGTWQGFTFG